MPVIDTDQLARDVTQPDTEAFQEIIDHFGLSIVQNNMTLNRRALRQIVFSDATQRQWLENLLHPLLRMELKSQLNRLEKHHRYCIVVIPLLFESEPNPVIQRTLVVDAPRAHQIERTQHRDQITPQAVEAIMNTQITQEERLARADDIIYNDASLKHLSEQVDQLHEHYILMASKLNEK